MAGPSGPVGGGPLRVLYVFAGRAREGDLAFWLRALAGGRGLDVLEVDVARRAADDLLKRGLRNKLLAATRAGGYDVVVASPPALPFPGLAFLLLGLRLFGLTAFCGVFRVFWAIVGARFGMPTSSSTSWST